MSPTRIKYWGLIPMSRRGYLLALGTAALFAAAIFLIFALMGKLPPLRTLWEEVPVRTPTFWQYWFFNNVYRIVVICLIAQAIDTFLVLRRFARKEAEEQAQQALTAMAPPEPATDQVGETSARTE